MRELRYCAWVSEFEDVPCGAFDALTAIFLIADQCSAGAPLGNQRRREKGSGKNPFRSRNLFGGAGFILFDAAFVLIGVGVGICVSIPIKGLIAFVRVARLQTHWRAWERIYWFLFTVAAAGVSWGCRLGLIARVLVWYRGLAMPDAVFSLDNNWPSPV